MAVWNIQNTLSLIEELKNCPCLWDPADPDYRKREVKAAAYAQIALIFGTGPSQVEAKIQALRNQFRREQRRLDDMTRSGVEPKRPTWFGYSKLLFLLPVYQKRQICDESYDMDSFDGSEITNLVEPSLGSPPSDTDDEAKPTTTGAGKRPKFDHNPYPYCSRDEFLVFGEYVGNEVRKLKPKTQIVVKHLINNVLYDAALGKLDQAADQSAPRAEWLKQEAEEDS